MKRYSTSSIKHNELAKLRALRDDITRDAEAAAQRRQAIENARLNDASWDGYKTNVRPLKAGQGKLW